MDIVFLKDAGRSHVLVQNPSVLEKGHKNVANTEGHPVLRHKKAPRVSLHSYSVLSL